MAMSRVVPRQLCGIHVNGKNYSVELRSYQDHSLPEIVSSLVDPAVSDLGILQDADFLLGPSGDHLNAVLAVFAQAAGKVLVTAGSGFESVFQGRDKVFGMLTPYSRAVQSGVVLAADLGVQTVWVVQEPANGFFDPCDTIPPFAAANGLTFLNSSTVSPAHEDNE